MGCTFAFPFPLRTGGYSSLLLVSSSSSLSMMRTARAFWGLVRLRVLLAGPSLFRTSSASSSASSSSSVLSLYAPALCFDRATADLGAVNLERDRGAVVPPLPAMRGCPCRSVAPLANTRLLCECSESAAGGTYTRTGTTFFLMSL